MSVSMLDVNLNNYKRELAQFNNTYDSFQKDNANRINALKITVFTAEPSDAFSYLEGLIHWAVRIYDTGPKINLSSDDIGFMSGIKHVDNTLKHTEDQQDILITDFISSTPKITRTLLKVTRKPQYITNGELVSFWQDISSLPVKYKNQLVNYNKYLKGNEIQLSVKRLDRIIKMYDLPSN